MDGDAGVSFEVDTQQGMETALSARATGEAPLHRAPHEERGAP